MKDYYSSTILLLSISFVKNSVGFFNPTLSHSPRCKNMMMPMASDDIQQQQSIAGSTISSRRQWYQQCSAAAATVAMSTTFPMTASAADSRSQSFLRGALVEYKGGAAAGNNEGASKSRQMDNTNVIFTQDHYYMFGTAPQFIPKGDITFPEKMPFVASKQRYDTLKKYRERVQRGIDLIDSIKDEIEKGSYNSILESDAPEYSIRPFGLLAYGFLASETGPTNELYLARWYINEFYLDVNDVKTATSKDAALESYSNAIKALNSLLGMLNRSITSKVGDPFVLL